MPARYKNRERVARPRAQVMGVDDRWNHALRSSGRATQRIKKLTQSNLQTVFRLHCQKRFRVAFGVIDRVVGMGGFS